MPIEAKLITDAGGGQTHQLKDALSIRGRGFHPDVEPVAVVDGHCLIFSADAVADPRRRVPVGRNAQMIAASKQPVVSALVLPRLIAERLQRSQGKRLLARGPGKAAARR